MFTLICDETDLFNVCFNEYLRFKLILSIFHVETFNLNVCTLHTCTVTHFLSLFIPKPNAQNISNFSLDFHLVCCCCRCNDFVDFCRFFLHILLLFLAKWKLPKRFYTGSSSGVPQMYKDVQINDVENVLDKYATSQVCRRIWSGCN